MSDIYTTIYDTPCVGGCGNLTNGSQYCAKLYCPFESFDTDSETEMNYEIETDNDIMYDDYLLNYLTIIEQLDYYWTEVERLTNNIRPSNWYKLH